MDRSKFNWIVLAAESDSNVYDVTAFSKNYFDSPYDCLSDYKQCNVVFPSKKATQLVMVLKRGQDGLFTFEETGCALVSFRAGLSFRYDPKKSTQIGFWPTTCKNFTTIKQCLDDLDRFYKEDFKTQPDAHLNACIFVTLHD